MGKKVKKKGRTPQKEKRVSTKGSKVASSTAEFVDDKVPMEVEKKPCFETRRSCPHFKKGFNLVAVTDKFGSAGIVRCENCRENAGDRRESKGKGKHGKKNAETKSEKKAIWVCLECGHFACGGVGLPSNPQCHALPHARQTRHPLAIQYDNPQLRWCFQCTTLIPVEKTEHDDKQKDVLSDVVKLIKGHSAEGAAANVEGVWFGSGSVKSDVAVDSSSAGLLGGRGYMVRGLINLGNTCFFNSVLQNLLAMDRLRSYFSNLDGGPLSNSLKKLYAETSPELASRNVVNPKPFFSCICSKAPQFKGYQQQDSHELLHCLLDRLSIEELGLRKQVSTSHGDSVSPRQNATFVDAVFGGQVSSTVSCLECGHSSTVYEPFLDLSLPVPMKKPLSRTDQQVSRAKKTKLPPRRLGRGHSKVKKDANPSSNRNVPEAEASLECSRQVEPHAPVVEGSTRLEVINPSASGHSSNPAESKIEIKKTQVVSADDSTWLDFLCPTSGLDEGLDPQSFVEGTSKSLDDSSWLDYLDPTSPSHDHDLTPQDSHNLSTVAFENKDIIPNGDSHLKELNPEPTATSINPWEDEVPLQVQDSEILLLPYKQETSTAEETFAEGEASSSVVREEESLDFDGFGDLFNEPEVVSGSNTDPKLSDSNNQDNGATTIVFSESDHDEVDDSDSPVSAESCLLYFTKPELLSNEHGWHCENCSKVVQRQRRMAKKKQARISSKSNLNGIKTSTNSNSLNSEGDASCSALMRNLNSGSIENDDAFNSSVEGLASQNGNIDATNHKVDCNGESFSDNKQMEGKSQIEAVPLELSSPNFFRGCSLENDSCGVTGSGGSTMDTQQNGPSLSSDDSESGESEDEVDSQSAKAIRNATKRLLIDKAPPILTIHLKRFSQDARGRLSKLNGHVDFRETFNLTPYMSPRSREGEKYDYRLIGVVEHLGSMRGGHYVAYVRGGERIGGKYVWYHASDAYVREAPLEEVLRSEAYILFYEQI